MKIVYSKDFENNYSTNPVENPDRVSKAAQILEDYDFVEPNPANMIDISRVHGKEHIERVERRGLLEPASLAAGGAIAAAELALEGEPAFGLIRPPGHHAAANRAWGMCFFNNMAIAVQRIRRRAERVLIIDIDFHFGDGTVSIFRGDDKKKIVNPLSVDTNFEYLNINSVGYLKQVGEAFRGFNYDIVGISAGFDTYVEDWGGLLMNDDFFKIGQLIKESAIRHCTGRRFAILEGGYHSNLKYNIKNFIEGFG